MEELRISEQEWKRLGGCEWGHLLKHEHRREWGGCRWSPFSLGKEDQGARILLDVSCCQDGLLIK